MGFLRTNSGSEKQWTHWIVTKISVTSAKSLCTPWIPAPGSQRQINLWVRGQSALQREFQDSLHYKGSFRMSRATQRNPVMKNKETNNQNWAYLQRISSLRLFLLTKESHQHNSDLRQSAPAPFYPTLIQNTIKMVAGILKYGMQSFFLELSVLRL